MMKRFAEDADHIFLACSATDFLETDSRSGDVAKELLKDFNGYLITDAYEYLKYLLEEMPNNHYLEQPDILERYLPWSEELPGCCWLKQRHKK